MTFFEAIILGAIQGLTEWLPISSSGHVFLVETYFGLTPSIELAAWLHGGSLLAVLIYYRKRIWKMLYNLTHKSTEDMLAYKIILATLISVPVVLILETSGILYSMTVYSVAATLAVTGIVILISNETYRIGFISRDLSWWLVVVFGFVQGLAVLPGISRSGLTIALLLIFGLARKQAVDFSFLAAVPLLAGALLFAISDVGIGSISLMSAPLWLALTISFVASLVGIHYMRKWIEHKWVWFAPYCFTLAGALFVVYFL